LDIHFTVELAVKELRNLQRKMPHTKKSDNPAAAFFSASDSALL
jgi:hypothetical protein